MFRSPQKADEFQNHLYSLRHHIADAQEACNQGNKAVVDASLADMHEIIDILTKLLPQNLQGAVAQTESIGPSNLARLITEDPDITP